MHTLDEIATQLGTSQEQAVNKVIALQEDLSASRREVEALQRKLAKVNFDEMIENQLETINGKQALISELDGVPMDTMREMTDWFRSKVSQGVMVLASDVNGKPQIIVAVSDALVKDGIKAGNLIKPIAEVVGGGGGGRPQMAQAGGKDSTKIAEALEKARRLIAEA